MSTAVEKKPKRIERSYGEAEIQRGLVAIAAAAGNTRLAAQRLEEEDQPIPRTTLLVWKKRHEDEYTRIRAEILPRLREEAADKHRQQEALDLSLSEAATARIMERLPEMEDRDVILAKAKADSGSGIHAEKALLYDGQPTQIVRRTSDELLRELEAEGLKVEAIEAEVVSEETLVSAERVRDW